MGQTLLQFGLQGTIVGVAAGIAIHNHAIACTIAAIAELWIRLDCYEHGNSGRAVIGVRRGLDGRPLIRYLVIEQPSLVAVDRSKVELVQIDGTKRQK